jgi:hypothetical protein
MKVRVYQLRRLTLSEQNCIVLSVREGRWIWRFCD